MIDFFLTVVLALASGFFVSYASAMIAGKKSKPFGALLVGVFLGLLFGGIFMAIVGMIFGLVGWILYRIFS